MAGMQASASAVLPSVSTLLSQLKSLHSDDDEAKAADALRAAQPADSRIYTKTSNNKILRRY